MIARAEALLLKLRRGISRSEWAARLLRLPRADGQASAPGLLIVQIDGLAYQQLRAALRAGRMPFLKSLLKREKYRLHALYSGLPSSTPAVQGELFYGVTGAVPAFSFRDPDTGRVVRMYDGEATAKVEARLREQGEPLLAGGSSYSNVYSGGARETHYCAVDVGPDVVLQAVHPFTWLSILTWHAWSFLRIIGLMLLELVLAVVDFARGVTSGNNVQKELTFILARVGICVLLRELVTFGASVDLARGLPIVHVNYLGYDEQAHRRGPSSAFAHWTLRGIDREIRKLWNAARRAKDRDYDVWVISDHGQEHTRPYQRMAGQTIQRAVAAAVRETLGRAADSAGPSTASGIQHVRAKWLGASWVGRADRRAADKRPGDSDSSVQVVAMGPVGLVYLHDSPSAEQLDVLANDLAKQRMVPLVLAADGHDEARAWTARGSFRLPADAAEVLGTKHPFLEAAARDLVSLCHHPAAGQLVLSGWSANEPPISFPVENGAHAGPGAAETRAFALLPSDVPVRVPADGPLRHRDLRVGALHIVRGGPLPATARVQRRHARTGHLRVMTYNVHGCLGNDGKISPERIARVIAQGNPDVVALQELDVGRQRSLAVDQAARIAELLEMEFRFHPSLQIAEEQYGNAILSRVSMELIHAAALGGQDARKRREPRGALGVELTVDDFPVRLINTHLGLAAAERVAQASELVGPNWLGGFDGSQPAILCGDFNAVPGSRAYQIITTHLRDAQHEAEEHKPQPTWFSRRPLGRIDHVFISEGLKVVSAVVPRNELARVASDHLPLIVELLLAPAVRAASISSAQTTSPTSS